MLRIPLIHATFPDPGLKKRIEDRLSRHWRRLDARKVSQEVPSAVGTTDEADLPEEPADNFDIPYPAQKRIARRAERIRARIDERSPLTRLKSEDGKRLEVLRGGVDLVVLSSEHRADEIAAELHAEMPWMGRATEQAWHGLRRSAQSEVPAARFGAMLLDGPPGIGKSHWARSLARRLGVPGMVTEATVDSASFGLVGSQRGWGNAAPGRLVNLLIAEGVANPVVLDEIEKAGSVTSIKGQTFSLTDAMLPLLEPISARNWSCPYFEVGFDMSWISWILASNDWRSLPAPLLSRCPPIRLERPTIRDLKAFASREGLRRGLSELSIEAICTALEHSGGRDRVPDLRTIMRLLEVADWMQGRPLLN